MKFADLPKLYDGPINYNEGFMCHTVHWRPAPESSTSEVFGEKVQMTIFIKVAPDAPCLCGSGKTFGACCQRQRYWYLICPNPGVPPEAGYSVVRPQSATFTGVDGPALRERLMGDPRLRCSQDGPERAFWIYEGYPTVQTQYGYLCFGDIELTGDTLEVTALSDLRMHTLLTLLREECGDLLGDPDMKFEPVTAYDKRTRTYVNRQDDPWSSRRGRYN